MIFGYSIGYMFFKKSCEKCTLIKDAAPAWRPLTFQLVNKTGEKEVWEGSYFRGRALADSFQTSCPLTPQVGSKPASFATPVVALLCTRRLHNLRGRAGEKALEGYRLFEGAFHRNLQVYDYFCIDCGNEATGFAVFTCQCIVSYFSIRHSPEQRYRLICPQSLRSRCL